MRRYARAVDVGALWSKRLGLLGAGRSLLGRDLPTAGLGAAVLCYHDVGTDPTNHTDYYLSPSRFRDQLEAIAGWGLRFTALDEILARLAAGDDLDGLVAVTFDDALTGVLEHALGVLRALDVPATVFAVADVLGRDPDFWPGAAPTLTPGELRSLVDAGVTIGSHASTHASLPDVTDGVRARELRESREHLEAITGRAVDLLAYPFGHHDAPTRAEARAAGYRAACTFSFGRVVPGTDPFAIPRFCMGPGHHRARLAYHLARPLSAWKEG